jgi:hypothetical protein
MYGKVNRVLEPLASGLVECKCLKSLVLFLEDKKVLKTTDRKHFQGVTTDEEILERLMAVLKKK